MMVWQRLEVTDTDEQEAYAGQPRHCWCSLCIFRAGRLAQNTTHTTKTFLGRGEMVFPGKQSYIRGMGEIRGNPGDGFGKGINRHTETRTLAP